MIICLVKMFSYRIDNGTKVHICLGEDRMIGYVPTRLCFGSGLGFLPAIIELPIKICETYLSITFNCNYELSNSIPL